MTAPEDRDWDGMLERIDLGVTEADLAAAEAQLQALPDGDVVPVSAQWVAATMAKVADAETAAAEVVVAPVGRRSWWRRVQHFAAAAFAVVGIQSGATAAVVTGVGVATVVVIALWPDERDTHVTMSYALAIQILSSAEQSLRAKESALLIVDWKIGVCGKALREVVGSGVQGNPMVPAAMARLADLRAALSGQAPSIELGAFVDDFDERRAALANGTVTDLDAMCDSAMHGVKALLAIDEPALVALRDQRLRRLLGYISGK